MQLELLTIQREIFSCIFVTKYMYVCICVCVRAMCACFLHVFCVHMHTYIYTYVRKKECELLIYMQQIYRCVAQYKM